MPKSAAQVSAGPGQGPWELLSGAEMKPTHGKHARPAVQIAVVFVDMAPSLATLTTSGTSCWRSFILRGSVNSFDSLVRECKSFFMRCAGETMVGQMARAARAQRRGKAGVLRHAPTKEASRQLTSPASWATCGRLPPLLLSPHAFRRATC